MTPLTDTDLENTLDGAMNAHDWTLAEVTDAELQRRRASRQPTSLHAAALWYAEQGIRIFPLSPRSKIPYKGSNGCHGASSNADVVDGWWSDHPDANIGIATGHTVDVVDIDGLLGQTSRAHHWPMFANLDVVGQVLTPRAGGMHLYVPARPGISNGAGLLPGVDYRGLGGYVVAPPSVNEHGVTYRWLAPIDVDAVKGMAA